MPSAPATLQAPPVSVADEVIPVRWILGIPFFVGSLRQAVEFGLRGGLVVAPAAPNLSVMQTDHSTREALLKADLVLTDSGLMVLLWRWMTGERVPRISGLRYLVALLKEPSIRKPGKTFWVMPNEVAQERTLAWLLRNGFSVSKRDFYLAPMYGSIVNDPELLARIQRQRPNQIVVGLGGGTQERLGLYLRNRLDYRPGIHCIGAAIGFLTGDQVGIPDWADQFFLGWLIRCLSRPTLYVPRYWRARGLIPLLYKYRDTLPAVPADQTPSGDKTGSARPSARCNQRA